jgi:uncharacterized protein (DUF983 family)
MAITCPECGSKDVDVALVAVGHQRCNSCGHSEAKIALAQSGKPDLVSSLIAIGAIALGAIVVGAIVDSLLDGPRRNDVSLFEKQRRLRTVS